MACCLIIKPQDLHSYYTLQFTTLSMSMLLSALYMTCYRKHDLRLSLNSYNEVPRDDPTIQTFVKTVHLSEGGELTFVPQAHDKEWTTRIIRHKVRHAYHVGKKNYIATVTKVNTYEIAPDDLQPESLKQGGFIVLRGNDWKEHYEMEVISYNYIIIGYTIDMVIQT